MGLIDASGFLFILVAYCFHLITTRDLGFSLVSVANISQSRTLPTHILAILRFSILILVFATSLHIVRDPKGLKVTVTTREGTHKTVQVLHLERLTTFTVWSWNVMGIYFLISSYCSIMTSMGLDHLVPRVFIELGWVLYELSFAVSFLVTSVTSFVLIPGGISRGLPVDNFFRIPSLLMHNANVIFMTAESMLNGLHFNSSHAPFAVLYGVCYCLFSWVWYEYKGVFYYFFLDYTGRYVVLWYAGLIAVLLVFFFAGVCLNQLEESHNVYVNAVICLGVYSLLRIKRYDK
mmetsp:Transcript_26370/g.39123  ORF Transcript_26370/g.39123 Transcript_26370/m.39123 type:complete len:291 (-) Transcript_26370:67-939(-)